MPKVIETMKVASIRNGILNHDSIKYLASKLEKNQALAFACMTAFVEDFKNPLSMQCYSTPIAKINNLEDVDGIYEAVFENISEQQYTVVGNMKVCTYRGWVDIGNLNSEDVIFDVESRMCKLLSLQKVSKSGLSCKVYNVESMDNNSMFINGILVR